MLVIRYVSVSVVCVNTPLLIPANGKISFQNKLVMLIEKDDMTIKNLSNCKK